MRLAAPVLLLIILAMLPAPAGAHAAGGSGAPASPGVAIGPTVVKARWHGVSRPLREMAQAPGVTPRAARDATAPAPDELAGSVNVGATENAAAPSAARDPALQRVIGPFAMPATQANFTCGFASGFTPPSPSADVGLAHYVVMSNVTTMIFDKAGGVLVGPVLNNALWAGFGDACENENVGTPMVLYDQLEDRWLLMQATGMTAPFSLCLAVSRTGDPTGAWDRWSIPLGNHYPDSPKAAMWRDGYYFSFRSFTPGFISEGNMVFALKRSEIMSADPSPTVVEFLTPPVSASYNGDGWLPADLDGTRMPPAGSAAYYIGSMDDGGPFGAAQDALTLWRFHVDWATPALSTFTLGATLPVNTFDSIYPCTGGQRRCIPQPGASSMQWLDVQSYRQRVLNRVTYRNFGTHESITCNQSVETAGATGAIAGIRWYELRDPAGTPAVAQQGTYSPGTSDGIHRWNGALAMDHQGNMALGYSVSNAATVFPGIRYTGRLVDDPVDTMPQGEGTVINGTGIQTNTSNQWGDYSCMNVDPSDDCTFWYVNQYYPTSSLGSWRLQVGSFRFPGCLSAVDVENGAGPPSGTRLAPLGVVRGTVDVVFTLAGGERRPVQLEVLDVTGRRVRRLLNEALPGGRQRVSWDLRADDGAPLRAGVYHVRLMAGAEQHVEGAIVVR